MKKKYKHPSYYQISSAMDGNENAIENILAFYDPYISKCCLRPLYDEYGNVYIVVDMELKGRIREALIKMILNFDISDIEVTVESGYSNVNVVSLTVEYVVNGQYRSYRDSVKSNEFDVEKYITYRLEDGNWKLTDMPISYYNLW